MRQALTCVFVIACIASQSSCTAPATHRSGGEHSQAGNAPKTKLKRNQYEVFGEVYEIMPTSYGYVEIGVASWYGRKFHGRLTANGETYDMYGMTAAHKSLPLPTMVRVTNLDNAQSVVLRVNDRGPFHDDRLIDLSYAAARKLGFDTKGIAPVVVEAIDAINHPDLNAKEVAEEASEEVKQTASGAVQKPRTEVGKNEHVDGADADHQSYYLQAGAFRSAKGAQAHLDAVELALPEDIPARVLTSETANGLLYKVWIGPMTSPADEKYISARIRDRNLGNPVRVVVD